MARGAPTSPEPGAAEGRGWPGDAAIFRGIQAEPDPKRQEAAPIRYSGILLSLTPHVRSRPQGKVAASGMMATTDGQGTCLRGLIGRSGRREAPVHTACPDYIRGFPSRGWVPYRHRMYRSCAAELNRTSVRPGDALLLLRALWGRAARRSAAPRRMSFSETSTARARMPAALDEHRHPGDDRRRPRRMQACHLPALVVGHLREAREHTRTTESSM